MHADASLPLRIAPLGVESEIVAPAALAARIDALWAEVPSRGGAVQQRFVIGGLGSAADGVRPRCIPHVDDDAALAMLTSLATIDSILAMRAPTPLLLHAAALALDDGRVIGFVGPSGIGKTTVARTLGAAHGYVTDETLAVTPTAPFAVTPYRKPLAIVADGETKTQLAPIDAGMRALPDAPLRLARLVLLDRDAAHGDRTPELHPVDDADAVLALLEQSSRLESTTAPLHALLGVLAATGGAVRVRYGEAATLVDLLPRLAAGAGHVPARLGAGRDAGTNAAGDAAGAAWRIAADCTWGESASGRMLVHGRRRWQELTGIGPALWRALEAGPAALPALEAAVVAEHGAPPAGDATDLVRAALDELTALGFIEARPLGR